MKYALINDNVIKEVVEFPDEESALLISHNYQQVILIDGMDPEPQVGWTWDTRTGELYLYLAPITPKQIRQALLIYGVTLSMIDDALGSLPEPTRSFALISWEYAVLFERRDPLVSSVSGLLGWGPSDIDNLWRLGASL